MLRDRALQVRRPCVAEFFPFPFDSLPGTERFLGTFDDDAPAAASPCSDSLVPAHRYSGRRMCAFHPNEQAVMP